MSTNKIIGIRPQQFVHVLDLNTNVPRVEVGPQTLVLATNEQLKCGPLPFIIVPPGNYCVIKNPRKRETREKVCECRHGYSQVRYHGEPFFLYPDEELVSAEKFARGSDDYKRAILPLPIIKSNHGLVLEAKVDHTDGNIQRSAGELWQLEGPMTYKPTAEAVIKMHKEPVILKHGQALLLLALQDCVDKQGNERVTGEEWFVMEEGAYLPGVYEKVIDVKEAYVLTDDTGLHLRAVQTVTDILGKERQPGEEWLVTGEMVSDYIPPIGVEVTKQIKKMIAMRGQYCVVVNPVDKDGYPQLGRRELRQGHCSFFLHPGESLEQGIQWAYILGEEEALVLQALEEFRDESMQGAPVRPCGEKWLIQGPVQYIPPTQVNVQDRRKAIPLSKNEGVYVRNEQTGQIRAVMGPQAYLLTEHEVLHEKALPAIVETLLKKGGGHGSEDIRKVAYFEQSIDPAVIQGRDRTRVVTYRCPGNTACQVYNYQRQTARVIFGPDLVILGPDEDFNVLSLSAGKPKKSNALMSLVLMLGPDFITDILEVETSDHARLQVKIAFNNHFEVDCNDLESALKIFSVPDFIGYACRQMGGRIRGAVAQVAFDEFHRHSAQVIQHAVFGVDKDGKLLDDVMFPANNMVISSVDIQSIEPVDLRMRDSLMKSVQMAIEIATNSIEAAATHEARRIEQAAKGELERQKLTNEKDAEKERIRLFELQAVTAAVESTGQAVAEAEASKERMLIECQSEIDAARLRAQAAEIEHSAELSTQNLLRSSELGYQKSLNQMEVDKMRALIDVEVNKFSSMVGTLGTDTLSAIATAGPETQVKLLKSLGLESVLITDGNSPINLFNTAQGLVGQTENK